MVTSSLGDVDHGSLDVVNESMLVCDAPRPEAAQSVPEGLWLADAVVRTSCNILDVAIDSRMWY